MAYILVVDDEQTVRELISATLDVDGHEIACARDGSEAVDVVLERLPDLIVLDIAMPRMDGWQFLDALHSRGLRHRTRVVLLSGRFDPSDVPPEEHGATSHFVRKPFEPEELRRLVRDALAEEPDTLAVRNDRREELVELLEMVDKTLG
ncbi:MAG TPA: response regulator [Actinomycetota bacterium]